MPGESLLLSGEESGKISPPKQPSTRRTAMGDEVYVNVEDMKAARDVEKTLKDSGAKAEKPMKKGAVEAVKKAGFSPDKKTSTAKSFIVRGKLIEVTLDAAKKTVFCKVEGEFNDYPAETMRALTLSGKATVKGGVEKDDIEFGIEAAVAAMITERVVPEIKKSLTA
jgi:prolyl oligopeptidase PreP (S9A serine peptidase family)